MKLIEKFKEFREKRFLKKHGFKTRRQYELWHDEDYNKKANRIKWIYTGYPYLVEVTFFHEVRTNTYSPAILEEWCENNCKGKWRHDWHRGMYLPLEDDVELNGIGGEDYLMFAFKNEEDYMWFKLRFS